MQMVGPSGEIVYFTRILPGGSQYGLKGAKSAIDRAFITGPAGEWLELIDGYRR